MGLVYRAAKRHCYHRQDFRDVAQVGCVALIHAIERYDPDLGVAFTSYAVPSIDGEIKRYFRDKATTVKVSRHAYELRRAVEKAAEDLTAQLERSPRIAEIAEALGESEEYVLESLEMNQRREPYSLEMPLKGGEEGTPSVLGDVIGADDHRFRELLDELDIREAIKELTNREQLVVHLRFYRSLSQMECAKHLQVSQMQISRLEGEVVRKLKQFLEKA